MDVETFGDKGWDLYVEPDGKTAVEFNRTKKSIDNHNVIYTQYIL